MWVGGNLNAAVERKEGEQEADGGPVLQVKRLSQG